MRGGYSHGNGFSSISMFISFSPKTFFLSFFGGGVSESDGSSTASMTIRPRPALVLTGALGASSCNSSAFSYRMRDGQLTSCRWNEPNHFVNTEIFGNESDFVLSITYFHIVRLIPMAIVVTTIDFGGSRVFATTKFYMISAFVIFNDMIWIEWTIKNAHRFHPLRTIVSHFRYIIYSTD